MNLLVAASGWLIGGIIVGGIILLIIVTFAFQYVGLYLQAWVSGAKVGFDFFVLTQDPKDEKKGHHRGNKIRVSYFPCSTSTCCHSASILLFEGLVYPDQPPPDLSKVSRSPEPMRTSSPNSRRPTSHATRGGSPLAKLITEDLMTFMYVISA